MIKIKLYILSVLLLLVSCTGNKVIDEQITRADSLMEANSDSALVALGMLESLRKNNPKMSKAQQMRFDLIYAKGMNKGFVDFTTDSVMKQVVAYYNQHGSANERMLAYYLLGCTYRDLDDSPASLDCYLQATEQADTLSRDCDYHTLARIYGQVGEEYQRQRMILNAKNAYEVSEKYSWLAKDTLDALIIAEAQVNIMPLLMSPQKVIEQFEEIYKKYKKFGYPKEAARSLGIVVESLVLTKQFAKAKRYMDVYERESGYFSGNRNPGVRYYTYFYAKGLYYLNVHSSDSAKIYFQRCSNMAEISNLLQINEKASIILRVNYTPDSISHLAIVDDLEKNIPLRFRSRILVDLHKIWQVNEEDVSLEKLDLLQKKFVEKHFRLNTCGMFEPCYVEKRHFETIYYNGKVDICDNFAHGNARGVITNEGYVNWGQENVFPEIPSECMGCVYYPVCLGECPAIRLKNKQQGKTFVCNASVKEHIEFAIKDYCLRTINNKKLS